jgi:hypothetical protein
MGTRAVTISLALLMGLIVRTTSAAPPNIPPAYHLAAYATGAPVAILWGVALQESGRWWRSRKVPWPWTLNIAGMPARFATHVDACRALLAAFRQVPPTRIDVGLTQVNLGYHAERVSSPCELLNPYRNLTIASQLLVEQHHAGESWITTAGRYHHPAGGIEAARYREALRQLLRSSSDAQP